MGRVVDLDAVSVVFHDEGDFVLKLDGLEADARLAGDEGVDGVRDEVDEDLAEFVLGNLDVDAGGVGALDGDVHYLAFAAEQAEDAVEHLTDLYGAADSSAADEAEGEAGGGGGAGRVFVRGA